MVVSALCLSFGNLDSVWREAPLCCVGGLELSFMSLSLLCPQLRFGISKTRYLRGRSAYLCSAYLCSLRKR